ncbi:hypothetical protein [Thioalkalivibrio sp. ALJ2]|uniref:hypothetical protein n=1 Tax=Thioalkalivibrio sp. ALJ2 TaxID=1261622 RepID=UPI00036DD1CF|nr:hypothetical protein [Thioalkalivibrio sp. ALJ2]
MPRSDIAAHLPRSGAKTTCGEREPVHVRFGREQTLVDILCNDHDEQCFMRNSF